MHVFSASPELNVTILSTMTITAPQIINALIAEHSDYLTECADDDDMSVDEYTIYVNTLSYDELVAETSTDDGFTLSDYVSYYSK